MRQHMLEKNIWRGGVSLDEEIFGEIVQPSFLTLSLPLPKRLSLPLQDSLGRSCRAVVAEGDYVAADEIVAVRDGGNSEDYHVVRTGLPGRVTGICREPVGYRQYEEYLELEICLCEMDQENNNGLHPGEEPSAISAIGREKIRENSNGDKYLDRGNFGSIDGRDAGTLREILKQSGIPGINRILFEGNGPRFCRNIIFNAVTDDPSLFYHTQMMRERPGQLLYGLLIFLRLLRADRIWVAVSETQRKDTELLLKAADRFLTEAQKSVFSLVFLPGIYPGARDDLLIRNLQGSSMKDDSFMGGPSKGANLVVLHMDEVLGAYDMVYDQRPWTWRHFLAGGCSGVNGCYELPIGTRLMDVWKEQIDFSWLLEDGLMIDGGLMAGRCINPEKAVVHGGMQSLLIVPRIEERERDCILCGRCGQVCPAGLKPRQWREKIEDGSGEKGKIQSGLCMGCGLCSYICPSRRRLKEYVSRDSHHPECLRSKPAARDYYLESVGDGPPSKPVTCGQYLELPRDGCGLPPAVITGYSSPYIRLAPTPFSCHLPPFKL